MPDRGGSPGRHSMELTHFDPGQPVKFEQRSHLQRQPAAWIAAGFHVWPHFVRDAMIKLYKRSWTGKREYHEAFVMGELIIERWGRLGTRGESRHHRVDCALDETGNLEAVLARARAKGFQRIDDGAYAVLIVQYQICGMGSPHDLHKLHALERRLNGVLGWTGLGRCDGGRVGAGTMEACCRVVDFNLARMMIEEDLRATDFADYARIVDENGSE